jgi:hypothetical protein
MRVQVRVRNREFTTSYRSYRHDLWRVLLWIEDLCVIFGVWDCYSCASRLVARRRLVERQNPSACATVNCNWRKRDIALYGLCISVIYEWVGNQLIINPIIRTRTRPISGVHVTISFDYSFVEEVFITQNERRSLFALASTNAHICMSVFK